MKNLIDSGYRKLLNIPSRVPKIAYYHIHTMIVNVKVPFDKIFSYFVAFYNDYVEDLIVVTTVLIAL